MKHPDVCCWGCGGQVDDHGGGVVDDEQPGDGNLFDILYCESSHTQHPHDLTSYPTQEPQPPPLTPWTPPHAGPSPLPLGQEEAVFLDVY